ncbi:MAG TPA: sigma-70 family RNA polymerase sigma factor [Dermatophilaceae bacterium]|nr:sigma-70 family RNA polymerase sigma factor [Dermatophilaceae bacterium]
MSTGTLADRAAAAFAAYRSGDEQRMGELVDLLTPILWHTARSQGLDASSAEDVVQTAWIRLVERAGSVQDAQAVLGWLVTTVRREAWRVGRKDGRAAPTDDVPEPEHEAPRQAELDPAVLAVLRDDQRTLWRHVQALGARCAALLRLVAFVDRPDYAAVSDALGMPIGSIGPTRGRCLAKLRTALLADPAWSTR